MEHYYKPKQTSNKRLRLQGTRKMGCTAHIILRQYILYPEYGIEKSCESKRQERLAKEDKLKQLRAHLQEKRAVKMKSMYYVSLPSEEAHHNTHPTRGAHIMAQPVNPNIAMKISELVGEGMTDPYEIRKALKHYIKTVLCASPNVSSPDPDDRAYYPTMHDLQNHIYKTKRSIELSKFDQQNLQFKIKEWEKESKQSMFYFRPFMRKEKYGQDNKYNKEQEFEQPLLWVHQMQWQKEIRIIKIWEHNDNDGCHI